MLALDSQQSLEKPRKSEERVSSCSSANLTACLGTQRRIKKKTHVQTQVTEDKKLKSFCKKIGKCFNRVKWSFDSGVGVQPLPEIDEVNMFKDDHTVVHIKKPNGKL